MPMPGADSLRRTARVLFDETHSESWTISRERASQLNVRPENSSYARAALLLDNREFTLDRNVDHEISSALLRSVDLLVFLHPCDPRWEATTADRTPQLAEDEIRAVQEFVDLGGSLLVITEYEHEKYGDNLNELLAGLGLSLTNETVSDQAHHAFGNPTWIMADVDGRNDDLNFLHLVSEACFYRAGNCTVNPPARSAIVSSTTSVPPEATLIGIAEHGKGRIAVVTDSDIFGDEYIGEYDHQQLWLNLIYWLCLPAFRQSDQSIYGAPLTVEQKESSSWDTLKQSINSLRCLQESDGSIVSVEAAHQASRYLDVAIGAVEVLADGYAHQRDYLKSVSRDLKLWREGGFAKPDFTQSLALFNPQDSRQNGVRNIAVFPMYTPNASSDVRFEALITENYWPDWLASIQRRDYGENTKFIPARLSDFTEGYASECAVFFPETVSILGRDENRFGIIFCGREAERYQKTVQRACEIVRLMLPHDLEAFLSNPGLILDTYALWDLIHDTSHSRGELPFDPFMVRQRAPFWMYALEELRVDLRSFLEAHHLSRELPSATYVGYAVLFDRIFRFAITGKRVRNYDALGGQLLFTALHARDVLIWRDNILTIDWSSLPAAISELYDELRNLYRQGQVVSKVTYWSLAHDLLCRYLTPNIASKWVNGKREFSRENDPRLLVDLVEDDEFPLGSFHSSLRRKMGVRG